jgi:aminoglycoside phosphotransferase family enzyme
LSKCEHLLRTRKRTLAPNACHGDLHLVVVALAIPLTASR